MYRLYMTVECPMCTMWHSSVWICYHTFPASVLLMAAFAHTLSKECPVCIGQVA